MYNSKSSLSSLPNPVPNRSGGGLNSKLRGLRRLELSGFVKFGRYIGRLFKINHMDFEFALWQMIYLFISPSKVFRNTVYRKQTKNRYSRDDPAFLVLLSIWFIISATCLSITLQLPFYSFIKFLFFVIFVDCIGIGLIVATGFWLFTNKFLRNRSLSNELVEWAFSFDIHLNAFFPPLVIIHFFQILIYSIITDHEHFTARLFANTLFMIAIVYYFYITFIGYSSLLYLNRTKFLLYPLVPAFFIYLITLITGPNICMSILYFYKYRIYY